MGKTAKISQKHAGDLLLKVLRDMVFKNGKDKIFQQMDDNCRDAVIDYALDNKLGALLYYYCRKLDIKLPEDSPVDRDFFLTSTASSMQRKTQLNKIFAVFSKHNIQGVLLKGAYTAEACYAHPGLRSMLDLDILVQAPDIRNAQELLLSMGYIPYTGGIDSFKHLTTLIHSKELFAVELHHTIDKEYITAEKIWPYTMSAPGSNEWCRILCPEMVLLHNCLHTVTGHFNVDIRDILEAALIITKLNPDPEKLWNTAIQLDSLPELSIVLAAVKQFFGESISFGNNKLTAIPPRIINDFKAVMYSKLLPEQQKVAWLTKDVSDLRYIQKLRVLIQHAFLPRKQIASMYACSPLSVKLPFCYFHRFIKYFRLVPEAWTPRSKDRKKLAARNTGLCQKRIKAFISENSGKLIH